MRAGKVPMTGFSDGYTRWVDSSKVEAVKKKFPGTGIAPRPAQAPMPVAPQTAEADASYAAQPAVLAGRPPGPDLSRVPPGALATLGTIGNQVGIRNPEGQLKAALSGLDFIPQGASTVADIATRGAARGIGAAAFTGALTEPVREAGYNALGQGHLTPGGWRGMVERSVHSGLGQGALTTIGRGIGGAMRWSENLPHDLAADALRMNSPRNVINAGDVGETFLDEGIKIGRKGRFTGSDESQRRLMLSLAREDKVAAVYKEKLGAKGLEYPRVQPTFVHSEIADKAYQRIMKKRGAGLRNDEKAALGELADEFAVQRVSTATPNTREIGQSVKEALEIKRMYDLRSTPTYTRHDAGKAAIPSHLDQEWSKAIADETRAWIRKHVPELGPVMEQSKKMVYLTAAMKNAESRYERVGTMKPQEAIFNRRNMGNAAHVLRVPTRWASGSRQVKFASQLPRMVAGKLVEPELSE